MFHCWPYPSWKPCTSTTERVIGCHRFSLIVGCPMISTCDEVEKASVELSGSAVGKRNLISNLEIQSAKSFWGEASHPTK